MTTKRHKPQATSPSKTKKRKTTTTAKSSSLVSPAPQAIATPVCSASALPLEILGQIFLFLKVQDLFTRTSRVCSVWRRAVWEPFVVASQFVHHFAYRETDVAMLREAIGYHHHHPTAAVAVETTSNIGSSSSSSSGSSVASSPAGGRTAVSSFPRVKGAQDLVECMVCSYANSGCFLERLTTQHNAHVDNHYRVIASCMQGSTGATITSGTPMVYQSSLNILALDKRLKQYRNCSVQRTSISTRIFDFINEQGTRLFPTIVDPNNRRRHLFGHLLENNRIFVPYFDSQPSIVQYHNHCINYQDGIYSVKAVFMSRRIGYWSSLQLQVQLVPGDDGDNDLIARVSLFNHAKLVFCIVQDSGDQTFEIKEEQMQVLRHEFLESSDVMSPVVGQTKQEKTTARTTTTAPAVVVTKETRYDRLILQFILNALFDGTDIKMCINWSRLFSNMIRNMDRYMEVEIVDADKEETEEPPQPSDRVTRSTARAMKQREESQTSSATTEATTTPLLPSTTAKSSSASPASANLDNVRRMKMERGVSYVVPVVSELRPRLRPRENIRKFSNYHSKAPSSSSSSSSPGQNTGSTNVVSQNYNRKKKGGSKK